MIAILSIISLPMIMMTLIEGEEEGVAAVNTVMMMLSLVMTSITLVIMTTKGKS
jgi:hypothetical protein